MQNHYITSEREGCRIPELWYMFARSGNIFITLTAVCMEKLENLKLKEEKGFNPPSTERRWGLILASSRFTYAKTVLTHL